jgi:hypothetical protein
VTGEDGPRALELGPGWPAWSLRVVLLLAGVGSVVPLLGGGVAGVVLVVLFGLAVVTAALPATPAPALLIGAVAVAVTAVGGDPLRPAVLVEIPLVHLVHVVASLAALVPANAVLRPSVLVRPVRRFVLVQLSVFAVVGLAEVLPTGRNTTVVELAGLVAATGLVAVAIRAVHRGR